MAKKHEDEEELSVEDMIGQINVYANHEAVKEKLKAAYILHRRRKHPRGDPPEKLEKVWYKLAKIICHMEWNPDLFVSVQFARIAPFPQPTQLYSQTALANMQQYLRINGNTDQAANNLRHELSNWEDLLKLFGDPEYVLDRQDHNPEISGLFKLCISRQYNLPDKEVWWHHAYDKLHLPGYKKAFLGRGLLTEELLSEIMVWGSSRMK